MLRCGGGGRGWLWWAILLVEIYRGEYNLNIGFQPWTYKKSPSLNSQISQWQTTAVAGHRLFLRMI